MSTVSNSIPLTSPGPRAVPIGIRDERLRELFNGCQPGAVPVELAPRPRPRLACISHHRLSGGRLGG